ncbi:MAG: PEP-utilizing enzyme, partial [Candidatus Micrarchaeota archaeon]
TREEESLLKVIRLIRKNGMEKQFLSGKAYGKYAALFKDHEAEYFWVPFDYGGAVWDASYFTDTARNLMEQGFDPDKRLREISEYYGRIGEKQRNMEKTLGLDVKTSSYLNVLRITGFLMDFKKECHTKSHFAYRNLLHEAAKRLDWSMEQAYSSTPPEIISALNGEKISPNPKMLRVLHSTNGKVEMIAAEKADTSLKKVGLLGKDRAVATELKGTCACAGTVRGKARVILSASDLPKLKKGEILVTIMTTPDFVHGMKNAAAIVTNDGGITCHAAIVAREFNIPCVVGTRIATSAFKDGDLLEVKASHGIVRKVEK